MNLVLLVCLETGTCFGILALACVGRYLVFACAESSERVKNSGSLVLHMETLSEVLH